MEFPDAETDGLAKQYSFPRVWDLKLYVIVDSASGRAYPQSNAETRNQAIQLFLHRVNPKFFPPFVVEGNLTGMNPQNFWEELRAAKGVDVRRCLVTEPEVEEIEDGSTV